MRAKLYQLSELIEFSLWYFKKKIDEIYVTDDNNFFYNKKDSLKHAKLNRIKSHVITKSDVKKHLKAKK